MLLMIQPFGDSAKALELKFGPSPRREVAFQMDGFLFGPFCFPLTQTPPGDYEGR